MRILAVRSLAVRKSSRLLAGLATVVGLLAGALIGIGPAQASPEPTQGLSLAVPAPVIIGQRAGGVVWVEAVQVFAVALDDAVLFVDETGAVLRTTPNIFGALDPREQDGQVFVASSTTGKIMQINPATAAIVETWQTGRPGPLSIDVTPTEIWFLSEVTGPQQYETTMGSITRSDDTIVGSRIAGPPTAGLRVRAPDGNPNVIVASVEAGGLRVWDVSSVPGSQLPGSQQGAPRFDAVELSGNGSSAWVAGSQYQTVDRIQIPANFIIPLPLETSPSPVGVAFSPAEEFVIVSSSNPQSTDIGIYHPNNPNAIAHIELGPGLASHASSVAASDSHVAVLMKDESSASPNAQLVVSSYRPVLEELEIGKDIGYSRLIYVAGQALGSITSATLDGTAVGFVLVDDGASIRIRLADGVTVGTKTLTVGGPLGAASVEIDLVKYHPDWTYTACPEITDSITRLYSAYFLREPDQAGFEFWTQNYSSGQRNLDSMSGFFSVSAEFQATYGGLSNAEFVDLIYQNVLGRPGEAEGRTFWISQLDSGAMSRGRVMINFSESSEYVDLSVTVLPLSGFFNWYPEGTTWKCGRGAGTVNLGTNLRFLDFLFYNDASAPVAFTPEFKINGQWTTGATRELPVGWYDIFQNEDVSGSNLTDFRVITDSSILTWMVVMSPSPLPTSRAGWEAVAGLIAGTTSASP